MTTPTYYAGYAGDFYFATVALHVTDWQFTDSANTQDLKNKSSGGFANPQACDAAGEITATAYYDGTIYSAVPVARGMSGAFRAPYGQQFRAFD